MKAKQGKEGKHLKGLPGTENQNSYGVRRVPKPRASCHVITELKWNDEGMYIPVGDVCHEVSEPRQVDKGVLVEGWPGTKCKYGLKWASLV